jgi:hypothetical protein
MDRVKPALSAGKAQVSSFYLGANDFCSIQSDRYVV